MAGKSVCERVEAWFCDGLPATGLSALERSEVIEGAQSSYLAEHVAKTQNELLLLSDKDLVQAYYWAMYEATR